MPILVRLETVDWVLEVVGSLPELPPLLSVPPPSVVVVVGNATLATYNRIARGPEQTTSGASVGALFFENTTYDFYLERKSANPVSLKLPHPASPRHSLGNTAHYSLNFANDVGYAEFGVVSASSPATVRVEVFPTKVDYRSDYVTMRDDVASIARNLVMTVQARTFGLAEPAPNSRPTLVEWLALMQAYFRQLEAAVRAVVRNPHFALAKEQRLVPPGRARKIEKRILERQLRRASRSTGPVDPRASLQVARRIAATSWRLDYDTPENRYVKAVLSETRRRIKRILHVEMTGDEDADLTAEEKFFQAARPIVRGMLGAVNRLLGEFVFQDVSRAPAVRPLSFVFHRHPHYAATARLASMLNGGLSVGGDVLQIGIKNISTLYEYWCFLTIVAVLRDAFRLEQQSLVKTAHLGVVVVLRKGEEASVRFSDKKTGKPLRVVYNRWFKPLPTISQKPDNIIELAGDNVLYLFDAKYRLAYDRDYLLQYGGIGPTTEDVNTMHRYRDAIVLQNALNPSEYTRGIVREAVVLFPSQEDSEYGKHPFFKSILSVGVGGVPLLPGITNLFVRQLERVLRGNGYTVDERRPDGSTG